MISGSTAARLALWLVVPLTYTGMVPMASAQETFAGVIRSGDRATLTVFDSRPLEQAAQTLASEFGLRIAAEDPLYLWKGDLMDIGRAASGLQVFVPKRLLIETAFDLGADGQPLDVPALLGSLVAQVSAERPFGYRVDVGPAGCTLVPTRMRNERGELVAYFSPLDTMVTLPQATRSLAASAYVITEAMKASTGYQIACCTPNVFNFDLQTQVNFQVDHQSARHALQRLMLLRPEPLVQHMRCQALTRTCFVNWESIRHARPLSVPH
jgi:hypothetical protein